MMAHASQSSAYSPDTLSPDTLVANLNQSETEVSKQQLSKILTLKKTRWSNNQRIQIFLYAEDSEAFNEFIVNQLGVFPYQLRRHWKRSGFSGRASPPVIVDSMDELIERLEATPGAIGFIPQSLMTSELQRVTISD
ncbi:hypothetical protein R50073_00790 [Maricurvus nonylphenolicus]